MCGRFALAVGEDDITKRFALSVAVKTKRTYNAAPGMMLPIIIRNSPIKAVLARWGFVPHWAKDPRIGYRMINARADGIAQKPAFAKAFRQRRCLIPATGFYEWKRLEGQEKVPYFIRCTDQNLFGFAGIWEEWKDVEGVGMRTFAIITTTPNDLVSPIHDRMPVILSDADRDTWLDPSVTDAGKLQALLDPYPSSHMDAYPVSSRVNNPVNDTQDLTAPVKTG